MRFNKQELATLATQPSNKFEKEGILYVTERQDGFFRRSEGKHKHIITMNTRHTDIFICAMLCFDSLAGSLARSLLLFLHFSLCVFKIKISNKNQLYEKVSYN